MRLSCCPSCLKSSFTDFCRSCRKTLFDGKRVSAVLPFSRPEYNRYRREQGTRISISGVQSKYSLSLNGSTPELTSRNGHYILKPSMSGDFDNVEFMPANEHLTMQIASQVFSIETAHNGLVFLSDETAPAYLTKRFDILPDGTHLLQEDFAQIAGLSQETHGKGYKYDFSYEAIGLLMKRHVNTYAIEIEKFFRLVVFNYLVHNGDAHVKNFSLMRDPVLGNYVLTPAYDLLNTRLHLPQESACALDLFEGDFVTPSFAANGFYARDDFEEFGRRLGMKQQRIERFIDEFIDNVAGVYELVDRSFLGESQKADYTNMVCDRVKALQYSYKSV